MIFLNDSYVPKPAYLPAILNDRCREWPLTFKRLPRQFPRTDSTPFGMTRRSRIPCCVWIGVKSSGASIVFVFFLFFPPVHLEAFPGYARKKRNQIHSTHPTTRRRATFHMSLEGDGPGVPATGVGAAIPDVSPATPSCLEVPRPGPQIAPSGAISAPASHSHHAVPNGATPGHSRARPPGGTFRISDSQVSVCSFQVISARFRRCDVQNQVREQNISAPNVRVRFGKFGSSSVSITR